MNLKFAPKAMEMLATDSSGDAILRTWVRIEYRGHRRDNKVNRYRISSIFMATISKTDGGGGGLDVLADIACGGDEAAIMRSAAALRSAIFCDNYISLTIRGFSYMALTTDEGRPVVE